MGTAACGGRGFKGRAVVSGDRPIGAGRCRQQHTKGVMPTPPPPRHRFIVAKSGIYRFTKKQPLIWAIVGTHAVVFRGPVTCWTGRTP